MNNFKCLKPFIEHESNQYTQAVSKELIALIDGLQKANYRVQITSFTCACPFIPGCEPEMGLDKLEITAITELGTTFRLKIDFTSSILILRPPLLNSKRQKLVIKDLHNEEQKYYVDELIKDFQNIAIKLV